MTRSHAQGPVPCMLVASSAHAPREDYPVQAALAASATPPQPATLPPPRSGAGGNAARAPKRREDWQRWLLWTVLDMGTALVLAVSLKVLRQPKAE